MKAVLVPAFLFLAATHGWAQAEQQDWKVFGAVVYTAAGEPIENGVVTIVDGKIRSVSRGGSGSNGKRSLRAAAVTPGMIDLSVRVGTGMGSVEQSREVAPDLRVANAIDLFDVNWELQARSGVTTALVNPPDFDVIGGLGTVVKTAGPAGPAGSGGMTPRTLKTDAVLRGAIGGQPSFRNHPAFGRPEDFFSRRPTTRMGVEWELRKAFYDAAAAGQSEQRAFRGSDELLAVLQGARPLMMQAWTTQDIRTAIFFKEEMEAEGLGQVRLILDAAAEAWKEPELLARSGASVVLPPYPMNGRTSDNSFMALDTAKLIHDLGLPLALSAHGSRDPGARLDRQAGLAMRGGLPFEAALEAVTIAPARMVGIDDRVGSLEVGKDADLVLWNGRPFETTSRVIGVVIDGRLILDPRPAE